MSKIIFILFILASNISNAKKSVREEFLLSCEGNYAITCVNIYKYPYAKVKEMAKRDCGVVAEIFDKTNEWKGIKTPRMYGCLKAMELLLPDHYTQERKIKHIKFLGEQYCSDIKE